MSALLTKWDGKTYFGRKHAPKALEWLTLVHQGREGLNSLEEPSMTVDLREVSFVYVFEDKQYGATFF
jgi:hypothetical protein